MKVLLLGADGFIGRHIAFHLRSKGVEVLAQARRPKALAEMGFATLHADLTDPTTHDPGFWQPHLTSDTHIVNAAGLLTGSAAAMQAVHVKAPAAAYAARQRGQVVLISAVGITADTCFAKARRDGEAVAATANAVILQAGLVLADTSYGGSSLIRALAAMPFVTPLVGNGEQRFNPIHANDLASVVHEALRQPCAGIWQIGGAEVLSQTQLISKTRAWLGLPPKRLVRIPLGLAHFLGRMGDILKLGPISATAVAQLQAGVLADPMPLLATQETRPRGFQQFLMQRPAGSQDLWQARLYLLKPLIRLTLAVMWLASAALGLFLPAADFLASVARLPAPVALLLARGGGLVDLALGIALLRNFRPKQVAQTQLAIVVCYSLGLTMIAPALWLDPFGGLLKNLPVIALILVHLALVEER